MPRTAWLAAFLFAALPCPVGACTIPVFRYALENWSASAFEALVFHDGPLTPGQTQLIRRLETDDLRANLRVTRYNLQEKIPKATRALWEQQGNARKPCLIVRYPDEAIKVPALVAPLEQDSIDRLLTSPARQKLIRQLTSGDSAVWVVLGGADVQATEKASQFLQRELSRLSKEVELPEQDPAFPLRSRLPLALRFGVLSIDRNDPREAFFVRSLLHSADDLDKVSEPIVFAVFGRGRVLVGLHGTQLSPANLERWASFLCGPCSCRVKELNPGIDTLLQADWEKLLALTDAPSATPVVSATVAIPPGESGPQREESSPDRSTREAGGSLGWLWLILGAGGVVALASGVWHVSGSRPRQGQSTDQGSPSTASTTQQPR